MKTTVGSVGARVTIRKMGHGAGRAAAEYEGEIVRLGDEGMIVVRCAWARAEPLDIGAFVLEFGDAFIEYYYPDEWFNIFEVRRADGVLKGWYCNITEPPEIGPGAIRWFDLALDLLVQPDGKAEVADEDEFAALALPADTRARALAALARLQVWAREEHPPFRYGEPPAAKRVQSNDNVTGAKLTVK